MFPRLPQYRAAVKEAEYVTLNEIRIPVTGISENRDSIMMMLDLQDVSYSALEELIKEKPVVRLTD